MIKIENGYCEIRGSLGGIKEDFRIFLNAIKYSGNSDLLEELIDVLKEDLEKCNEQS